MATSSHSARVTQPMPYKTVSGKNSHIPVGPCLVEQTGEQAIDIIWGPRGQSSTTLAPELVAAATDDGRLVLLD